MDVLRKPPLSFDVLQLRKTYLHGIPYLVYYPLLYIQGSKPFSLPKEDLEALRLISSREAGRSSRTPILGAQRSTPHSDGLLPSFYPQALCPDPERRRPLLRQIRRRPLERPVHQGRRRRRSFPLLEGVKINGHWAIIYSKLDISSALEGRHDVNSKGYTPEDAPEDSREYRDLFHAALIGQANRHLPIRTVQTPLGPNDRAHVPCPNPETL